MATKPRLSSQLSVIEPEKPRKFYLKKFIVLIVTVVRFIFWIVLTCKYVIVISDEYSSTKHVNNFVIFQVVFLILSSISALCEIIGFVATYKERIGLVKLYLAYCIARWVLFLVLKLIFASVNHSREIDFIPILVDSVGTILFAMLVYHLVLDLNTIANAIKTNGETISMSYQ